MAASELERNNDLRSKNRSWIIIASVFLALAVILGLCLLCRYRKRRLHRARNSHTEIEQLDSTSDTANMNERQDLGLPLLDFIQIAKATDYFSFNNKLGEGGFGTIYKVLSEYPEAKLTSEQQTSSLGETYMELVKSLDDVS